MARRPLTSGTVCRLRDSLMIIVAEPVPFGHHWFLVYIEKEQKKMFKKSFSRGLLSLIFYSLFYRFGWSRSRLHIPSPLKKGRLQPAPQHCS